MVEALSISGSRISASQASSRQGMKSKSMVKKPTKLIHCTGQGGNPSSLAMKKNGPNPKAPKTNIFAAQK